jgi:hypothetical protein
MAAETLKRKDGRTEGCCGHCRHFSNDPAVFEATFPGVTAMCSGYASVRLNDGLCEKHEVYLSFRDRCADFARRQPE